MLAGWREDSSWSVGSCRCGRRMCVEEDNVGSDLPCTHPGMARQALPSAPDCSVKWG